MPVFQEIPIDVIQEAADNPRRTFDEAALQELTASIRVKGILVPLLVYAANGAGTYDLIAGARRLRAARAAGLTTVPVLIREATDRGGLEEAVIENLQREQVPPLEEARALQALTDATGGRHLDAIQAIAQRLGKSPTYVWDRLKLLDLISPAQDLLTRGVITVAHAIRLARLTPEDQARALDPHTGGLLTHEQVLWAPSERDATDRALDEDQDGDEAAARDEEAALDLAVRRKAVSVRELDAWIAEHVRFQVTHAAEAAPLEFGPVAVEVGAALARPGRGKKVLAITYDHYVCPDARAEDRTYCRASWKRADGHEGSQACDRGVLGVVVTGPGYGAAFRVCVHKDCDVHWKAERLAREKHARRQTSTNATGKEAPWEARERERKALQAKEDAARAAFAAARPGILAAMVPKIATLKGKRLRDLALAACHPTGAAAATKRLGTVRTADDVLRHLVYRDLIQRSDAWNAHARLPKELKKAFGLDVAAIVRAQAAATTKGRAEVGP